MSASTEFATSLPFLGYKQRNAVLDNFFYDTTRLTMEERAKLTPLADREGSIIVVPPSNSDREIRHYSRALRFMTKEGPAIRAIAVAGVGSSALGTAALARSIADALDADVAGIVTGYGMSDMMSEALGGWFAFGAADRIRHTMERAFARMRPAALAESVTPRSDAAATLAEILLAAPPKLDTSSPTARARWSWPTRSSAMSTISRATTARSSSACTSSRSAPWSACRRSSSM